MNSFLTANNRFLVKWFLLFTLIFYTQILHAQKRDADSLLALLNTSTHDTMHDTVRVKAIRYLCLAMHKYNPDSALTVAYDGLKFAKKIKYKAGISNMYEVIAIILTKIGSFNKALSYYIENLKIEESLKSEDGIICANINIGIIYVYMLDYDKALKSYLKAYSSLNTFKTDDEVYLEDLKYSTNLNIGDVYDKMQKVDSAFLYYNNSLNIAVHQNDNNRKGLSMLGLGNVYAAKKDYELSLANYRVSLQYLIESKDEDIVCDVCLAMAKVFKELNQTDSTYYYGRLGLYYAKKNNFLTKQLDISSFLSACFASSNKTDSAYQYLAASTKLKDSLMGIEKLRASEQILFDENLRQLELLEKAIAEKEERRQQLQHIFIGLLIPALFLITVLLARIRIKIKLIKFLGVISLLFLFEYLTLLLHPLVQKITHHTPILEILIFVAIASLIIPTHHKIEHWMIELLVNRAQNRANKMLLKTDEAASHKTENNKQEAKPSEHTHLPHNRKPPRKKH